MFQVIDPPICLCGTPHDFVGYTQKKEEVWHCPACDKLMKIDLPVWTITTTGTTISVDET